MYCFINPQLFARGNYTVMLYDIIFRDNDLKAQETTDLIMKKLTEMEEKHLLRDGQTADSLIMAISVTSDLAEALKNAFYVQVCCNHANTLTESIRANTFSMYLLTNIILKARS